MSDTSQRHEHPGGKLRGELEAAQRNTLWPDTMINGSKMDAALWKGAPNAPMVQRLGIAVFGGFFFLAGIGFALGLGQGLLGSVVGIAFASVGIKLLFNAIWRSRKLPQAVSSLDDEV